MGKMRKAEEIFVIVRELASSGEMATYVFQYSERGFLFTWKQYFEACKAVMNPSKHQLQAGFKCTVGNMLRALCRSGTVTRLEPGQYVINREWPMGKLYVSPGEFLTHGTKTRKFRDDRKGIIRGEQVV